MKVAPLFFLPPPPQLLPRMVEEAERRQQEAERLRREVQQARWATLAFLGVIIIVIMSRILHTQILLFPVTSAALNFYSSSLSKTSKLPF